MLLLEQHALFFCVRRICSGQKRTHRIRFDAALVPFSVAVCSFLVWIQLLTFHILFTQTDNGSFSGALCAKLCKYASVAEWAHDVIKNLIINLNIAKAIYSINYNGDAIIAMEKPRETALWISLCLSQSVSLCVCLCVCVANDNRTLNILWSEFRWKFILNIQKLLQRYCIFI